ncbi:MULTISPECIES: hypothetical protein [unclassified Pseudomonas]|uniref:hypothetical protein n=1 Tax=unclassified Pseudomonas TaxID=196821 RepID=UPI001A9FACA3|nr:MULTISPECIES: hypothetical protein [unclassified Pseudomonas]
MRQNLLELPSETRLRSFDPDLLNQDQDQEFARAAAQVFHSFRSHVLAFVMAISFKQCPNQLLPNDLYTHMVTKLFTGTA